MRKIGISIVFSILTTIITAQSSPEVLENKFRFGSYLGMNYSFLQTNELLNSNSKIYNGIGYKFGFSADYFIAKNVIISPKTEIAFNKIGAITRNSENTITNEILPVTLNLISHFVYRFNSKPFSPYVLVGPNLNLPIKQPKLQTDYKTIANFALDFGIGFERKIGQFTLAPEIRYSFGMNDVIKLLHNKTTQFHSVSIVFNFKD